MAALLPISHDGDLGRSHLRDSSLEVTRPVLPAKGGMRHWLYTDQTGGQTRLCAPQQNEVLASALVISGHFAKSRPCPLDARRQHCSVQPCACARTHEHREGSLCTKNSNNNNAGFSGFLKVGVPRIFLKNSPDGTHWSLSSCRRVVHAGTRHPFGTHYACVTACAGAARLR